MADLSLTIDELLNDEPEPQRIVTGKQRKNKAGELSDAVVLVFPRRPTEVERGMILGAANAARRALRAKLLDPETDEHKYLLMEPLRSAEPESLRSIWISGKLMERAQQATFNSLEEREYVPEPEGALVSPAQQDAYDAEVQAVEDTREKSLAEILANIQKELIREAAELDEATLLDTAVPAHVETLVQREWSDEYAAQVAARCTFTDARYRKPYFKTVEQAKRLRDEYPRVFKAISDMHNGLLLAAEPTLGF